jgi:hypothetical protein
MSGDLPLCAGALVLCVVGPLHLAWRIWDAVATRRTHTKGDPHERSV